MSATKHTRFHRAVPTCKLVATLEKTNQSPNLKTNWDIDWPLMSKPISSIFENGLKGTSVHHYGRKLYILFNIGGANLLLFFLMLVFI